MGKMIGAEKSREACSELAPAVPLDDAPWVSRRSWVRNLVGNATVYQDINRILS